MDGIGGNPYEPRPKKRIAKKIAKDYKDMVRAINALISKRYQPTTMIGGAKVHKP